MILYLEALNGGLLKLTSRSVSEAQSDEITFSKLLQLGVADARHRKEIRKNVVSRTLEMHNLCYAEELVSSQVQPDERTRPATCSHDRESDTT